MVNLFVAGSSTLICSLPARRLNACVNLFAFGLDLQRGEPARRAAHEGQGAPSASPDATGGALPPSDPPVFLISGRPFWGRFGSILVDVGSQMSQIGP